MTKLALFDNTRVNAFKVCPRYFYFAHVRHWRVDEKSVALTFGSSWHAAMDVVWSAQDAPTKLAKKEIVEIAYDAFVLEWMKAMPDPDELSPDDLENLAPRTPFVAKEMIHHYLDARSHIFNDPSFKLLAVEQPFAVPLDPNDAGLFYVGRLDKIFEYRNQVLVGEHKTTSSYKKDGPFRNDFIDGFAVSAQIDGYIYALRTEYGKRAAGVWIDGALVHKIEHAGFSFIPESRTDAALDSWLYETHTWLDGIRGNIAALAERRDPEAPYMDAFPRNTNSCVQYGRCPWLDVCRVCANPEALKEPPLGYHYEPWSPFDVIKLQKLGFTVEGSGEPVKTPHDE